LKYRFLIGSELWNHILLVLHTFRKIKAKIWALLFTFFKAFERKEAIPNLYIDVPEVFQ